MSTLPDPASLRALLLDVEGTTTPVDFVYGKLFPLARARLEPFLRDQARRDDVRADVEALRQEHAQLSERFSDLPPWKDEPECARIDAAVAFSKWLMDRDRKSTPLKSIQGKIWEEGYRSGELRGEIYADVPGAFARWRKQGKHIAIFSSGSVLAQKLLFAHSTAGDLTRFIDRYFDTTTGPKQDERSYRQIAVSIGLPPSKVLFISDVAPELEAARSAGMATVLCVRPGGTEPGATVHPVVGSFHEIFP